MRVGFVSGPPSLPHSLPACASSSDPCSARIHLQEGARGGGSARGVANVARVSRSYTKKVFVSVSDLSKRERSDFVVLL